MVNRRGIIRHIPNTITCMNMLSGSIASLMAFEGYLVSSALLILLSAVFDFCDGLSARLLKAYSAMGKELDSLADVISFGFAPGAIAFAYLKLGILGSMSADFDPVELTIGETTLLFSAFLIPVFSGLRLAKFNVDTNQTTSFIGMPTPANAIFWASWPLVLHWGNYPTVEKYLANPWIIVLTIIVSSLLLVSKFHMFSLKAENLNWRDNSLRYTFLLTIILLAFIIKWMAIPMIIVAYIFFSGIQHLFKS